jgi:hypothetical protein
LASSKEGGKELTEKELGKVSGGGAFIGSSFSQVIKASGDGITQMARKQVQTFGSYNANSTTTNLTITAGP